MIDRKPRLLISCADERTWRFDRSVLFLGEWCRTFDRKHVWQEMDGIVANPYGIDFPARESDFIKARNLEVRLFPLLCQTLNQYHQTQQDERFWNIVLGHWWRRFIDVILNRVNTLQQCLHNYQVSGMITCADTDYVFARQNSSQSVLSFGEDTWNNALNTFLLKWLYGSEFPIEFLSVQESTCFQDSSQKRNYSLSEWGYRQIGKAARYLMRDSDAFIISSYLPRVEAIKLQLALRQCPQLWTSPQFFCDTPYDPSLRNILSEKVSCATSNIVEDAARVLMFKLLPICYLEGFPELIEVVNSQPWPTNPKFIFTSNNFDTDEVFKLWSATKSSLGVKYYIGQHGNYGVTRHTLNPSTEETISDKFLTWGWDEGLPQHTPAFIFKKAGEKLRPYSCDGGLLLVELCVGHRITTWDNYYEFTQYFYEQQSFVSKLESEPRDNLTLRLHAEYKKTNWSEIERWASFDSTLKIDHGTTPLRRLLQESRLVVHSYDSTGILETLFSNIPTIAFWQNDLNHLRDSAKPYYELLIEVGIVHLTPESAARKVNEVWENVDCWWNQDNVQEARLKFCEVYAKKSNDPVRTLKSLFEHKS
ncbi:LIC12162 family transferase [Desulfosediminicola sp.]|uniref:LIC12162 family transferase n=1 Tax=Desulfosediminicola sp. TaxID=2886825 RepID=UPI003AF1E61D